MQYLYKLYIHKFHSSFTTLIHKVCILTWQSTFSQLKVSNLMSVEVSISASCLDVNILCMNIASLQIQSFHMRLEEKTVLGLSVFTCYLFPWKDMRSSCFTIFAHYVLSLHLHRIYVKGFFNFSCSNQKLHSFNRYAKLWCV